MKDLNVSKCKKVILFVLIACILFNIFMILAILKDDKHLCGPILMLYIMALVLGASMIGLCRFSGDMDRKSIRILCIEFTEIDECMKKLMELESDIFSSYRYIGTYIFNASNNHYYELYIKDDIKWARDIGTLHPIMR